MIAPARLPRAMAPGVNMEMSELFALIQTIERSRPLTFGIRALPMLAHSAIFVWGPGYAVFHRLVVGIHSVALQNHAIALHAAIQ